MPQVSKRIEDSYQNQVTICQEVKINRSIKPSLLDKNRGTTERVGWTCNVSALPLVHDNTFSRENRIRLPFILTLNKIEYANVTMSEKNNGVREINDIFHNFHCSIQI